MKTVLSSLMNMKIGIYLENNQFVEGILLNVKQDYLAVDVNGTVSYYTLEHIQAITNNAKDFRIFPESSVHLNSHELTDVLRDLKYNWVTINSLSDQALFGVLSNVLEDAIIVINNQGLHCIAKSHIANIHKGMYEKEKNLIKNNEKPDIKRNNNTEQNAEISKEKIIQIEEINELDDLKEEVEQDLYQQQVVLNHKDETNTTESKKLDEDGHSNIIKHLLELLNSIGQSINLVNTKYKLQEMEYNTLQMDQENSLSVNNEFESPVGTNSEEAIQETIVPKVEPMHASFEKTIEVPKHVDEVIDSTNKVKEEQIIHPEPSIRKNERRILLTPWSKMNYDQNEITIPLTKIKESSTEVELPIMEYQKLIDEEHNVPTINKVQKIAELNVAKESQELNEEVATHTTVTIKSPWERETTLEEQDLPAPNTHLEMVEMDVLIESQEPADLVAVHTTETLISPRERKEMLEKQYYALMRHAEQNSLNSEHHFATYKSIHPAPFVNETNNDHENDESPKNRMEERKKGEKAMLEKQFYSLMRHAAKMYRQLRDF